VSPYTTRARQSGCASTSATAFSKVARPDWTIESASSAMGMRPLNDADV
jgi:hypothetical protein